MVIPFAAIIVLVIVVVAGALALAAFVWAVQTKQFSVKQLNEGAKLIFDDEEPIGTPTDMIFQDKKSRNGNHR